MEGMNKTGLKKAVILSVFVTVLALLYFLNSTAVISGVKEGLAACVNAVIPSLFPFMVLCSFLINSRLSDTLSRPLSFFTAKILHLPKYTGTIILLSLIGGYPIGARSIAALCRDKRLDAKTAARMLCFCVNAGPAFLITAVGTKMFGNPYTGVIIFAAQTIASIIIAIFSGIKMKGAEKKVLLDSYTNTTAPLAEAFVEAVTGSALGILSICGFVVIFSAILALLKELPLAAGIYTFLPLDLRSWGMAVFTGVFEVTLGCASTAAISGSSAVILACALCSFGGLSVICQVTAFFNGLKVSMRPYILSRFVHIPLSCLIAAGLQALFPGAIAVFSFTPESPLTAYGLSGPPLAAGVLLVLCIALILFKKDRPIL
ncbi:sporulation integral membrane protein YlbJ [Acetanaerobacterium elongatum]|uniref:Sporulation integral membrane protein YlbJ n=2 Tax=Acetanaerobacterium elongatum TaxID=258515 RepID=A0A1H0A1R5_9FIRM|nr:sporulation integral membrane protein YlbJ [Acetanaerobacterium elongatum]